MMHFSTIIVFLAAVMMPKHLQAQYMQTTPCSTSVSAMTFYKDGMCYFSAWGDCTFGGSFPSIQPFVLKSAAQAKELILSQCPLIMGSCPYDLVFKISSTDLPTTMSGITIDPNLQQNVANGECAVLSGTWVNGVDSCDYNLKLNSNKSCDAITIRGCQFKMTCPESRNPTGICYTGNVCPNPNSECVDGVCCEKKAFCPNNRKVGPFCDVTAPAMSQCMSANDECVAGTCCGKLECPY